MKKIIIANFALAILLLLGVQTNKAIAGNPPVQVPEDVSKELVKDIRKHLYVPNMEDVDQKGGSVYMMIEVKEDGKLCVERFNSDNNKLGNFVSDKINHMKTDDYANYAGQVFYMNVKYDIQAVK